MSGENASPVATIQAILHDYPFSAASIFRELLQNSDDARATKQIFVLDMGKSPALMAYNDSQFQEEDWKAIRAVHTSAKSADISKIGKYGVGFNACYHITDEPQILSGPSFAILDPLRSGGMKINFNDFKKSGDRKFFDFFSNMSTPSSFGGTVIRLPLRSKPSKLSQRVVLAQELDRMIGDYINEELSISLLFLNNLRIIEIWKVHDAKKTRLATWSKSETMVERQSKESPLSIYDSVLSDGQADFSWRIIHTKNAEDEAKSRLAAQAGGNAVNLILEKHKLRPDVRFAYPLFTDKHISGRLFTFLPLSSITNFPVHIHAQFALTSSRQSLRKPSEIGTVAGSENDVLIKWNSLLFGYYIPQAWSRLLKTLAEDAVCEDIFIYWPPYPSSITSDDGPYWRNILQATLKCAIQSDLAIWPKVAETHTTTYVDLKSSLVVAKDQVHSDVIIALSRIGLTLVQMPETHMKFLGNSITKLTPRLARDQIGCRSLAFDSWSRNQRRVLCEYFLSEKDFSNIYGLPLFPTLGGSYISLDNRNATSQRYTALTTDEADTFRTSAGDAIPIDQLPREVAVLIERGTIQANIVPLSPQSAIAYLSSEPPPLSDQRLVKFWTWLEKWRQRDQAMALLKSNTELYLIPTSKGLQLVSSPAFLPAPNVSLFEKLGVAFVSSVLPSSVVRFLYNHGVVKDINDMNHFLAAINLEALEPLSDDEAKSMFDHISTCYRSLSSDNMVKLKKLPIFPVLVPYANLISSGLAPSTNAQSLVKYNTSVKWRTIVDLSVKGISPMSLIPLMDNINFLDKSSFSNPTCPLLKALQLPLLSDEDILLLALDHFSSQPKSLQAAFVSYIRRTTNSVTPVLRETRFIHSLDGALRSPVEVIDPNSTLKDIFLPLSSGLLIPIMEDDHDREIIADLRDLEMVKASLSLDIVQERIRYISANHTSPEALVIARSLLSLMNDPSFVCASFPIDRSLRWLPTEASGLVSLNECIDWGRRDTDLFDEVLTTLDKSFTITPSFRDLLGWDKPLPLDVLTKQLDRVLGQPNSDSQYRKINEIIRELASRPLGDADVEAIQAAAAGRPWVPTKSGTLALPSSAVFGTPGSSYFHEISFSKAEKKIYTFLVNMGCNERPPASAIISEPDAPRENPGTDRSSVQQPGQSLEIPDSTTDKERASSDAQLVRTQAGSLVDDFPQLPQQVRRKRNLKVAASSPPSPTLSEQLSDDDNSMDRTISKPLSQMVRTSRPISTLKSEMSMVKWRQKQGGQSKDIQQDSISFRPFVSTAQHKQSRPNTALDRLPSFPKLKSTASLKSSSVERSNPLPFSKSLLEEMNEEHFEFMAGAALDAPTTERQWAKMVFQESLLVISSCEKKHDQAKSAVRGIPTAGKWFLERPEYRAWKAGMSSSPPLLLTGIPGSGKTVISSVVIDDLRGSERPVNAVIFLYCESPDHTKYDTESFLGNLFGQLLLQLPQSEYSAVDRLVRLYNAFQPFDFEDLIINISRDYEKVFVVIDSIDECKDPVDLLESLPDNWHLFITSLRKHPVRDAYANFNRVVINSMDTTADIRRFVRLEVRKIEVKNPKLARYIVDKLTLDAQGSFFWPIFHMRQLRRLRTEHQIHGSLEWLPQGMDDQLPRALRLESENQVWGRTGHVIRLVRLAVRPMTIPELAEALGTAESNGQQTSGLNAVHMDMDMLIDGCSDLIRIPADKQRQPDFIVPAPSLKVFLFGGAGHNEIAKLCLTYLKSKLADYPPAVLARTSDHPFMRYAVTGCLDHIRASGMDSLETEFRAFFAPGSKTFEGWCRLYKKQLGKFATFGVGKHIERLDCAHLAVWFNLPVILRKFSAAELAAKDYRGLNTLHVAVGIPGSLAAIDCLLDKIDINSLSRYGDTALHIAVSHSENPEMVIRRFWRADVNVHAKDRAGRTALHLLILNPERALLCMATLLQSGANVNALEDASLRTPLHLAAAARNYVSNRRFTGPECQGSTARDYEKIIRVLLDNDADIESQDEAGNTPLHIASENVNASVVKLLLERGASVISRNKHGSMAIHLAVGNVVPDSFMIRFRLQEIRDQELTVHALLDHGADVNATIQNSQTPLHLAARSCCELCIFNILIQKGAAVTANDDDGVTALHLAVKMAPISNVNEPEGHWRISWIACRQIIEFLIENGCDPSTLHDIVEKVCQFLESHYPDIVTTRDDELKPDHPSVTWFKDVVILLCSKGATVSSRTNRGYDILRFAMESWASWILENHQILAARRRSDDMSLIGTYLAWSDIAKLIPRN